jgi:hypothetical protein
MNKTNLWHLGLGHITQKRLKIYNLCQKEYSLFHCPSCMKTKQHKTKI